MIRDKECFLEFTSIAVQVGNQINRCCGRFHAIFRARMAAKIHEISSKTAVEFLPISRLSTDEMKLTQMKTGSHSNKLDYHHNFCAF